MRARGAPRDPSTTRRPQLAFGGFLGLPRSPDLLAGLRLGDRDRLGLADDQLDGLTGGEVVAEILQAAAGAQLLQQLIDVALAALGALGGGLQRLAHLIVAG